eukprot:sb/3475694/
MYPKNVTVGLIGYLQIDFSSSVTYTISSCETEGDFHESLPSDSDGDKKWKISKTDTTLTISCNGVVVLDYTFSDSSKSSCAAQWQQNIEHIKFTDMDTASDKYGLELQGINRLWSFVIDYGCFS